jgi:hypothetical protein
VDYGRQFHFSVQRPVPFGSLAPAEACLFSQTSSIVSTNKSRTIKRSIRVWRQCTAFIDLSACLDWFTTKKISNATNYDSKIDRYSYESGTCLVETLRRCDPNSNIERNFLSRTRSPKQQTHLSLTPQSRTNRQQRPMRRLLMWLWHDRTIENVEGGGSITTISIRHQQQQQFLSTAVTATTAATTAATTTATTTTHHQHIVIP